MTEAKKTSEGVVDFILERARVLDAEVERRILERWLPPEDWARKVREERRARLADVATRKDRLI